MKIYVATKWEEAPRAQEVMRQLKEAGHTITYDWTRQEQESTSQAIADWEGVMSADALVLIVEKKLYYKGAWVEFGLAAARQIPIYVIGHAGDKCLFLKLPNVKRGIEELAASRAILKR